MKLNQKIAKQPDDLKELTFVEMKALMKKELKRLVKYTSAEQPTECILLGGHDYTDKEDMLLPIFGKWKGKFKEYAKKEVVKEALGAIGTAYYNGLDEETNQQVISINLAKGKGKKKIKLIERKFKKLVPQATYKFELTEISEEELERVENQVDEADEQEELLEETNTATTSASKNVQELAKTIQQQAIALATKASDLFPANSEPSLKPLASLINSSKQFWAAVQSSSEKDRETLSSAVYAAYAKLEKGIQQYLTQEKSLDEDQIEFVQDKLVKVFVSLFKGKNNTAHSGYGTGKHLHTFAKSYSVYQAIADIGEDIQELADQYKGDKTIETSVEGLNNVVEDTKTLLKGGYQLRDLIKQHYKDAALRNQLLETLGAWEEARAIMMEQLQPYLRDYYEIFESTLTQSKTAKEIEQAATALVKDVAQIEKLLPKFAEMDQFRKKIEKLDTAKVLTQELQVMAKVEGQLKDFLEKMKNHTATWITQQLKTLVKHDEALTQHNQKLQSEQAKLDKRVEDIEKQKASDIEWTTFWTENQAISAAFEKEVTAINQHLEKNNQLLQQVKQSFRQTYEGFTAILEQANSQ